MKNQVAMYIKEIWERAEREGAPAVCEAVEALTQKRIREIRETPTEVTVSGTSYYVSADGDDSADGKSPETAWRTVGAVCEKKLLPGDGVFFRRGDVFRGNLFALPGVTYSAYGSGEKPMLLAWDKNSADPKLWKETDEPGVWEYAEVYEEDIGAVVFDERLCARKVYRSHETDGRWLDYRAGRAFDGYHDLTDELSFWHGSQNSEGEPKTGKLYLRCEQGNPGALFSEIEMNKRVHGITVKGNGVHIDNLCIAHAGMHGIGAGKTDGLTVTNCEIRWTGGTIQRPIRGFPGLADRSWPTPFGNAVEIYGEARNYTVDNCYIWQAYDAGVTHQGPAKGELACENVRYTNNVITDCVYGIEIFYGDAPEDDTSARSFSGTTIENNIVRRGGGFGHEARPDEGVTALIRNGALLKNTKEYVVRNNIFDRCREWIVTARNDGGSKAEYRDNVFVQTEGGRYAVRKGKEYRYDRDLPSRIAETETESGSRYIYVDKLGY